ncbi:hypothetical protein G5714_021747 [Onychostoma macrolepis]|uniref:Uncharacterized protein n=1 Tax=Onychostoma macrolepis TaxID=369639 RepID=A0A7J6BRT9_9TELE|nr:hypothetical protein G5714_021747 [Onychostoma macrolepis]
MRRDWQLEAGAAGVRNNWNFNAHNPCRLHPALRTGRSQSTAANAAIGPLHPLMSRANVGLERFDWLERISRHSQSEELWRVPDSRQVLRWSGERSCVEPVDPLPGHRYAEAQPVQGRLLSRRSR